MAELDVRDLNGPFTLLPMDDVIIGKGCLSGLGDALANYGIEKALLITGNTLFAKTDLVDKVKQAAGSRIAEVIHETSQHVPRSVVLKCAEQARTGGIDGVISFGGGSANDTAKAVVLALAEDITDGTGFDKMMIKFGYPDKIEIPAMTADHVLPSVAIPTTLSAGEYTHFIGITDEDRKVKDLYIDKKLTAKVVFLDPEVTMATPHWLWLSSGMRSVDHAVEALCSTTAHPFTDALAAHSLKMLAQFLRRSKADPQDQDARLQLQVASWMSVFGLANVTLGLSHGTGHQLGARCGVPHGVTSCVMMHNTMRFNKAYTAVRQAWIAEILGVKAPDMDVDAAADAAADAILQLTKDLEQPFRLRDVGVTENDFEALANDALQDLIVATNPRPVTSPADVVELLKLAY